MATQEASDSAVLLAFLPPISLERLDDTVAEMASLKNKFKNNLLKIIVKRNHYLKNIILEFAVR